MKKIKILSFASLPLAMALLAGCGGDPQPDPGPDPEPVVIHTVTNDEWVASFNADKVFGFADNFKLSMNLLSGGEPGSEEFIIDGSKMKDTGRAEGREQVFYYTSENDKFYRFYTINDLWVKQENGQNPSRKYKQYLEPFSPSYESFAYDEESQSYKCETFEYEGASIKNLEIKFDNKQVVFAKLEAEMAPGQNLSFDATITYGGQTVTLPEVHEHECNIQNHNASEHWMECDCGYYDYSATEAHYDLDENGFCDVCGYEMGGSPIVGSPDYGYKINDGSYVYLNHDSKEGNKQWDVQDVEMTAGEKITFANISTSLQEPAVLTTLYIGGETQGFEIAEGVLTAGKDGKFSFVLTADGDDYKVNIIDNSSPIPEVDCRLMGSFDSWTEGYKMVLKDGGSGTEYVIENVTVESAQYIKVKFGDDYIDEFKETGGENNAFVAGVCKVESGNAFFNLNAVVNVYFESDQSGNYGVFIELKNVISPYKGEAFVGGQSVGKLTFKFNKVDSSYYEYALLNAPTAPGIEYELQFSNGSPINVRTIEDGGEGANFEIVGTRLVYSGTKSALDFYLKDYGAYYDVYVEAHVEPVTCNTLYLDVGVWDTTEYEEKFAAYFFSSTGPDSIWVMMTKEDSLYKVDKVEGYDKVIFVRCDPEKDPLVDMWDAKWNQTEDLNVPIDEYVKCYILDWGGEKSPSTWGKLD